MSPEKMVRMANQIATFMASQHGEGDLAGATGVQKHLKSFWEPHMLDQLFAHVDQGGAGLHPLVLRAAQGLREPA
jgi:formate dehydrogenase subunit delta